MRKRFGCAVLAAFLLCMSGCSYMWPSDGEFGPALPPVSEEDGAEYMMEPVEKHDVVKSRSLHVDFSYADGGTLAVSGFSLVSGVGMQAGESGTITVETGDEGGGSIQYPARVVSCRKETEDYALEIVGGYDPAVTRPGATAKFRIVDEEKKAVLAVDKTAIRWYYEKAIVCVWENGVKTDREIETGLVGDEYVEVLSGLSQGEMLIR